MQLGSEGGRRLPYITQGMEAAGGGRRMQVPVSSHRFQFVLALVHIQFSFLTDSLADL